MDNKKDKRKKILKISGLIGLFLLVFGLSYALFTVTLNGTKKVKVKTGKLELQLLDSNNNPIYSTGNNNTSSYEINLDNQVPVDDETGLGTEAFEFKLKNNGSIKASYTIYLDDVALEVGEDRLADEYVRYSLTKNGSSDSAQDLTSIGTAPNRKLDEGVLDTEDVNTYTLKVWVKESATNEAMDKVFNTALRVEGTQYVAPPASESEYGEEIASTQLSENITATYYQPEGTGYNNNNIKRMSNVKKIDNETTYEGGTLVISGTGMLGVDSGEQFTEETTQVQMFLADVSTIEEFFGKLDSEKGIFVYKYNPSNLVIEEGITDIGKYVFCYITSITELTLPSTLESIGEDSFSHTGLINLELNEGLQKIEMGAFNPTPIVSVKIPDTVTLIKSGAFGECEDLKEVYISNSAIEYFGSPPRTFYSMASNSKIYVPTQEVANSITSFIYDSSKTTVVIDPTKFE